MFHQSLADHLLGPRQQQGGVHPQFPGGLRKAARLLALQARSLRHRVSTSVVRVMSSARRLHPSSPNRKQSDIAIRRSEILTKLCLLKRRRNKIYKSSSFYQINRINRIDSLCCSNSIWIRVMQGLFFYVWNKIMKVKPWKNLKCYPNIIITETFCESS